MTDEAFRELLGSCLKIYVDDLLVHSGGTSDEDAVDAHLTHLEAMFIRADKCNLRFQLAKCSLLRRQVRHLVHAPVFAAL